MAAIRSVKKSHGRLLAAVGMFALVVAMALFKPDISSPASSNRFGIRLLVDDAWIPLADAAETPERVVLLVHGLDEPGSIWDDLAPRLVEAGHRVARLEYPNDQRIARSTRFMITQLRALRERRVHTVAIVAHSMGGLISRDALTAPDGYNGQAWGRPSLPDVSHLITLGTPNSGSPFAPLRELAEIREQLARAFNNSQNEPLLMFGSLSDGRGQAGRDLEPDSAYLRELNTRRIPTGVRMTIVAARIAPGRIDQSIENLRTILGVGAAERFDQTIRLLGDGVVPMDSALLDGVDDVVFVDANHRSMVKLLLPSDRVPPAIPIVIDRLSR